jgi:hypothetical protein
MMNDIVTRLRDEKYYTEHYDVLFNDAADEIEILREAVIAMAEDGWLYFGLEGPSEAQEKCLKAYRRVMPNVKVRGGTLL